MNKLLQGFQTNSAGIIFKFFLLPVIIFAGCSGGGQPAIVETVSQPAEPEWQVDEDADVEAAPQSTSVDNVTLPPVASSTNMKSPSQDKPETIYRPDDLRLEPDMSRLKELGIARYESKHFRLYTDIDPDVAKTLPPLIDQVYQRWVDYFGELPPNRSGTEYQITGYIIGERDRFQAANLLPDDLPLFEHGRHRGQEFWMNEQEFDYYRRHLTIHEATHCFMMTMPGIHPPLWYLEGMAEYFATHRLNADGTADFGVMPDDSRNFVGFGRIQMIQNEIKAGRLLSIDQTTALGARAFSDSRTTPYAWSWALCQFLDSHPRYQDRFRELSNYLVGPKFFELADTLFAGDKYLLTVEWDQFVKTLDYGWEIPINAFVMHDSDVQRLQGDVEFNVHADRFWQSTGYVVEAGNDYTISATGQVTLANEPKPWTAEPQGITIQYANGHPIGTLMVAVLADPTLNANSRNSSFESLVVGRSGTITPSFTGLLMFSINDFGSGRSNNSDTYHLKFRPLP